MNFNLRDSSLVPSSTVFLAFALTRLFVQQCLYWIPGNWELDQNHQSHLKCTELISNWIPKSHQRILVSYRHSDTPMRPHQWGWRFPSALRTQLWLQEAFLVEFLQDRLKEVVGGRSFSMKTPPLWNSLPKPAVLDLRLHNAPGTMENLFSVCRDGGRLMIGETVLDFNHLIVFAWRAFVSRWDKQPFLLGCYLHCAFQLM